MSYLSLYRKWRPGTFSDVLGQDHVTETLAGALREDRVAHAYLFSGPRGTGKTSTARILAKSLNCVNGPTPTPCGVCGPCREIADGTSLDVYEMDAASHTSVDDVREIRERIPFASAGGARKVYIIDEAHQLSTPAFNALLKMLEEPPSHVVFVLCTTESHKLPATVVSRCQRFEFRRLTDQTIALHLSQVAEAEQIKAEPDALGLVARHAHGSARDALSLLDQAAGTSEGIVSRETIVEILGEAPSDALFGLSAAIAASDITELFRQVEAMVARGWDPRTLLRQLMEHMRTLFLFANGATDLTDVPEADAPRYREQAESLPRAHLDWVIRVLGEAQADVRASTHPRLTLEVTLARAAVLDTTDPGAMAARIERLERALVGGATTTTPAAAPARTAPPKPKREAKAPATGQTDPPSAQAASAPVTSDTEPDAPEPVRAEPGAAPPVSGPGGDLDAAWQQVLQEVRRQSRVTYTHLQQGTPVRLTDQALVVSFSSPFHPEQIVQRPEQLARVVSAIGTAFGAKLRFDFEVGPQAAAAPAEEQVGNAEASSPDELVVKGLGADLVEETDS